MALGSEALFHVWSGETLQGSVSPGPLLIVPWASGGLLSLSPGPKGVFHLGDKRFQAPGQDNKPDRLQRYWVLEALRVFLRFSPNSPISSAKDM